MPMSLSRLRGYWQLRMASWVRRRQGLDVLPLTLQRRRIYILPTRAGVGFMLLLFLMLVAGLNYANSLALFLTFLLVGFGLVAMQQCHRNLLGTCLQAAIALPTFARRPGALQLAFENPSSLPRLRIAAGLEQAPTSLFDLAPNGRQRVELTVVAAARGLVHIDRLKLTTTHPFGLFRAWTWIHTPLRMVVYPRPVGVLPMPTDAANKSGKLAKGGAGADEWLGLRPFRDGDSPRQVDWKAYAREAPLLVKEYSSSGGELRMFRFERLPGLSAEQRLEQMARWVVDAEAQGERYGIELPAMRVAPDRGPEHRHHCLRVLALHGLQDGSPR
jgi:uncharacterized protein (DUF58 family)